MKKKKTNLESFSELGEPDNLQEHRHQGKRNDIKDFIKAIKEGKSQFELIEEFPLEYSKYEKMYSLIMRNERFKKRKDIVFPIKLKWFTIEKPDPANKQRHWWLHGASNLNKSYEITKVLGYSKYYLVGKDIDYGKYRLETYMDEDLIIFNDIMPSMQELIDMTDTHPNDKEIGTGARYTTKFWKVNHSRTVIVIHNDLPSYNDTERFTCRFNVVKAF